MKQYVLVAQLCLTFLTLWPGTHQVALSLELPREEYWSGLLFPCFSRGHSKFRDCTWVSCIAGEFFAIWITRGALWNNIYSKYETIPIQKNIYFCFIDYAKALDYVDHIKLWKILKDMGTPDPWPASWETCIQIRKQQLELNMEQKTGSK